MLSCKSELLVEVWDKDGKDAADDDDDDDDLMEKLIIPAIDTAIDFGNSYSVEGKLDIGKFTLLYYNLTAGQTACVSVDNLTYKPTPKGKSCRK